MRRLFAIATMLLCSVLSVHTFAQTSNATLSGTVSDATGALIPGVTITATNTQTGVVSTEVSNEAGTYSFASLQPGVYKVNAELPGFQTQSYTKVELGISQQVRLNFALQVGSVAQSVEVSVAADTLLATSSSSVGSVLPEYRVRDLPVVGRDALDLVGILAGVREANSNLGTDRATETFAGVYAGAGAVNTTRDGISVNDGRYAIGVYASTKITPELVGEMRVIVAPADAETGRGVGQVQILTKSGTNEFHGGTVWNIQNSALNANLWNFNRIGTIPSWYNRHQFTGSVGGPIKKNKTFFFGLFDGQMMHSRENLAVTVLTEQARQGIFRFFPGVQNGNVDQTPGGTGNTAIGPVVDRLGNPVRPAAATGDLQTVSVFGRDSLRTGFDSTGFIKKMLADMPLPNDFGSTPCNQTQQGGSCASTGATDVTDGLNIANFRWTRHGDTLIGPQFGTEEDTNRRQMNVKIDHNFNSSHKLSLNYTYELDTNVSTPSPWPGGWEGKATREPRVFTSSLVSTLSSNLVNEFRLGYRRSKTGRLEACQDPEVRDDVFAYLPKVSGYPVIPHPQSFSDHKLAGSCNTLGTLSPAWTYADSLSWTKAKHTFKGGVEIRPQQSYAFSSVTPAWIPAATGGPGNFPVTGIETAQIPGLLGKNLTNMRNLLLTLSGSVSNIQQSFRLTDPKATAFVDYRDVNGALPPGRNFVQNEWSGFFKDDWKITPSLSLNLGVRYDYYSVPYEADGFTLSLVGGGNAGFGWTGRSFADYWNFGPQKGDLTAYEFVGPKSPNPSKQLYKNDRNNFGPAVGFSWSLPWFGKDRTTIRGGSGITYAGTGSRANSLDVIDQQTFTSTSYLDLSNFLLPVPRNKPLQTLPVTQRTQSVSTFDPNGVIPYIQTFNLSVTRAAGRNTTLDVRYVGTRGVKLYGSVPLNQPNYLTNGLLEALNITRAGGDAPLFDQMLKGLNLNPGVAGFGPVGTPVNGVMQTGSMHLRQSTTYRGNIANGNYTAVANSLNTSTQITGQGGGLLRNGGFPENFIVNNPQYVGVTLNTNPGSSIYHSMQAQLTFRPTSGFSSQATYVWSKAITACANSGCSSWASVLNRSLDRTLQNSDRRHELRFNGSYELPFGPNRLLLPNSHGMLARLVEQWQLSWIFGLTSGAPLSLASTNTYLGYGRPEIVGDFPKDQGNPQMTAALPVYFGSGVYKNVADPQCANVTPLQGLQTACTNTAVADAQGRILLQNAAPGTLGRLGQQWITGPSSFRFDLSASKTVRIAERQSVQVRVDARNVLNHPILGNPNLDINSADFGTIPVGSVSGARQFQAQLRYTF